MRKKKEVPEKEELDLEKKEPEKKDSEKVGVAVKLKVKAGATKFEEDAMKIDELMKTVEVHSQKLSEMTDFEVERTITYGGSGSGKSRFYLMIVKTEYQKGGKPEEFLMCILNTDRDSGVSKIAKKMLAEGIPREWLDRVIVFTCNDYSELVKATQEAVALLYAHYEKTKKLGRLAGELLDENWMHAQAHYIRTAYGETLGFYFAKRRQDVLSQADDPEATTAHDALRGWGDWPIIKYFHNYYWIDRVKRLPFHLLFTAEEKELTKKEAASGVVWARVGYKPAGEKDNIHRFDDVIYMKHTHDTTGDHYFIRSMKLTGYEKLFSEIEVTGKNAYEEYLRAKAILDKMGLKKSKIDEVKQGAEVLEETGDIEEGTKAPVPPKVPSDFKLSLGDVAEGEEKEEEEEKKSTIVATPNVESFDKKKKEKKKEPKTEEDSFKLEL